jgi:hypothetical protein
MQKINTITLWLAKLSACVLVTIAVEGLATLGLAFQASSYHNITAIITQIAIGVLCLRLSVIQWK